MSSNFGGILTERQVEVIRIMTLLTDSSNQILKKL